jgi:hypothetical protein
MPPAEHPRYRWRIECGAEVVYTHPMSLGAMLAHCDKVWPAPAIVTVSRRGGASWQRSGGEYHDGGGRAAIAWQIVGDTAVPA